MNERLERNWALGCHLAALLVFLGVPFGNILGPLVVWLIKKEEFALVDEQGKEAMNFQISLLIYTTAGIVLAVIFAITLVLIPLAIMIAILLIIMGIFNLIMVIIAALKVSNGEPFEYPLTIRILK